jgi:hypothetical protein
LVFSKAPDSVEHWIKLITALHMVDEAKVARGLLEKGIRLGVDRVRLVQLETILNEPLPMSLDSLNRLIVMGKTTEALIRAHMLVSNYPESETAQACLNKLSVPPK